MTAKERLRELVETLSEDDMEEALLFFESLVARQQPLSSAQRESIERGLSQLERGEGIPHDEVFRDLGLRR